jgi:hypothetical protein
MTLDIYYIHRGKIPRYLLCSMENTRVFNPGARIFLLGDASHTTFKRLGVTLIPLNTLPHDDLDFFHASYRHTSGNPEEFERFCFARWFYLHEAVRANDSKIAIHLDSDCLIFDSADALGQRLLPESALCYFGPEGNPHLALFRPEGISGMVTTLRTLFQTEYYRDWAQMNWREMRRFFCDMAGLDFYVQQYPGAVFDQIEWPDAIVEQTMSVAHGFDLWPGRKKLKRVQWRIEQGKLVPYLSRVADGSQVRALALHYKGASKRYMRRFNQVSDFSLAQKIRTFLNNHLPPINRSAAFMKGANPT